MHCWRIKVTRLVKMTDLVDVVADTEREAREKALNAFNPNAAEREYLSERSEVIEEIDTKNMGKEPKRKC